MHRKRAGSGELSYFQIRANLSWMELRVDEDDDRCTTKHSCGCFSSNGVGGRIFIDGIIRSDMCRGILDANIQKSVKK